MDPMCIKVGRNPVQGHKLSQTHLKRGLKVPPTKGYQKTTYKGVSKGHMKGGLKGPPEKGSQRSTCLNIKTDVCDSNNLY